MNGFLVLKFHKFCGRKTRIVKTAHSLDYTWTRSWYSPIHQPVLQQSHFLKYQVAGFEMTSLNFLRPIALYTLYILLAIMPYILKSK
jgi:hypothetical protein